MRIMLVGCLMGLVGTVYAQCPAGIPSAGNPQCVPPNAAGWPNGAHEESQPRPTPRPKPVKWASRWGAVAIDSNNNAIGVSSEASSQREAEFEAMDLCGSKGGGGCKVSLTYRDQCGVVVWGDNFYATAHAASVPEASVLAMARCEQSSSNCKVFYSDCAHAVPVQ
ncbi:DUF4189 domain-containing protein [Lysobacter sp. BMK333-48F3]|uniref:DUF4189 domain-containing protein n=1 Tax=Lysobacter sp. BMK333-48F3 TaxID=2867962 RepID=UPI001C8BD07B|nr:DUF4189 domain-containing protein [Lysobacter sp. BMK333-48F3]MBX9403416.1 DUF4189 domain-containing protein [Lysobacter sp. BMK333-48F3]